MMIEPPIDSLIEKSQGNKYILSIVASKRAKEIESIRGEELANADKKSISLALEEIMNNETKASDIE